MAAIATLEPKTTSLPIADAAAVTAGVAAPAEAKPKRTRAARTTPAIKAPFQYVSIEFLVKNDGSVDVEHFAHAVASVAENDFQGTSLVGHKVSDAVLQKRRIK